YSEMVWKPDTRLLHPLPSWSPTVNLAIESRERAIERATECGRHCATFTDGFKFRESSGGGTLLFHAKASTCRSVDVLAVKESGEVAMHLAFGYTLTPVHHADDRSARAQYSVTALVAGVAPLSAQALL
ncbi:hypothetical protein FOL47_000899, partial [Perkinsus chesapeaki]